MTDHAGLIRAEHVLTARTGANRGRRHVVSNQGWADSSTRGHGERVPASHERRRRETGEQFVDETGLQDGAKRWRGAGRNSATLRSQHPGIPYPIFYLKKTHLSLIYNSNGGSP